MELSGSRTAMTRQLLTDASQLVSAEQEAQRTETGIAGLKGQLAAHKSALGRLIATEKATLASLTVPQQQQVQGNSIGANGSSAPQQYTVPTSTQAGRRAPSPTPRSARPNSGARRAPPRSTSPALRQPPGPRPVGRYPRPPPGTAPP